MTDLNEKPLIRRTRARVPHGVTPRLVVTLYPGGLLGLREAGRRIEYELDLGTLYTETMMSSARKLTALSRKIKRETGQPMALARAEAKKQLGLLPKAPALRRKRAASAF